MEDPVGARERRANARWTYVAAVLAIVLLVGLGRWYLRRATVGPQTVEIKANDVFFEPRQVVVKSGDVTIILTNQGGDQHNLVLSGPDGRDIGGIPAPAAFLLPGASGRKTFTLTSGEYTFYCSRDSHYQLGMHGTMRVK